MQENNGVGAAVKVEKGSSRKPALILSIVFVVALAVTNYGVYAWQHNTVERLNSKAATADKDLKTTKKTLESSKSALDSKTKALDDLTQKHAALSQQYQALVGAQQHSVATQADLQLTVGKATTFTNGCCDDIGVIITLKNTTTSNVLVQPETFKLKDAQGHAFAYSVVITEQDLGSEFTVLRSQSLAPGESVTGALGYTIANKTVLDYTLLNGDRTYSVKAVTK